jgi:ATP-dependent helicase/DNAse subunit B
MPITLITGPANAGKAELVLDGVRRHVAHGEEPLLVLPTRADVEHYLRELAGEGAVMGVRVERFSGLIAEAVRRAEPGAPALGELAREQLVAGVARAPDGAVRGPGFVRALRDVFAELQVRRVGPARLRVAVEKAYGDTHSDELGVDLGSLFGAYHRALERIGRPDAEQAATRALDTLRERPALWRATPVLVYGFDDLTRLQLDAIETLGAVVDADVTVSLAYEPGRVAFSGRSAAFHALAPLAREHRALPPRAEHYAPHARGALSHIERSLFEPGATRISARDHVRLLHGGGAREELELVARNVRALLDRDVLPEQIAVVARHPERSAELVREVFTAAGIPFSMPRSRPFGASSLGRGLVGLLRCVDDREGDSAGAPGDLLAWLRVPGLLHRPELADALEVSVRRRGGTTASQARALWEERNWPLDAIDRLETAQARGPRSLLEQAARQLDALFAAPRRRRASVLAPPELDEARALAAGRRALAELRELARLLPDVAPASAAELASCLEALELDSEERPGPGEVAVLDPLDLRARRVRALFLTGLQEGAFPARARTQPLLGEQERARIADASGLVLNDPEDVLAAERYLLYAVVSRPEELLFISWHETDDDGEPLSRSLFVDDVCDVFEPGLQEACQRRELGAIDDVPTRGGARLTDPVEGLSDARLLGELGSRVWSASSLERWVSCPVRWFVERLLEPGAFEPEAEPLARGALAHAALHDTLAGLRARSGSARISSANLGEARRLLDRALAEREPEHPLSVAPERQAAVRRRLRADLVRYLEYAAGLDTTLEPGELELGFGFTGEDDRGERSELPAFDLGGGVLMRGRIDRIDRTAAGDAVIVDYKSRRASPAGRWLKDGDLQVALYMQAAEQLLGARVRAGLYQPLSGELQPRGAIACDVELGLDSARTDLLEEDGLRELLAAVLATARDAAAEAARGELEPRPASCSFKGGCAYPTICRCEW